MSFEINFKEFINSLQKSLFELSQSDIFEEAIELDDESIKMIRNEMKQIWKYSHFKSVIKANIKHIRQMSSIQMTKELKQAIVNSSKKSAFDEHADEDIEMLRADKFANNFKLFNSHLIANWWVITQSNDPYYYADYLGDIVYDALIEANFGPGHKQCYCDNSFNKNCL
jgi:hypothetical protein